MPRMNIGPGYARLNFAVVIIENDTIVGCITWKERHLRTWNQFRGT